MPNSRAAGEHAPSDLELGVFREKVLALGARYARDLPWRKTRDPYAVWVSEVMLQQTQVSRVDGRWQRWLGRFPTVAALAEAAPADVLEEWQGLGYNRRVLMLKKAAQAVCEKGGQMPVETADLLALPGIGPATAAGIRAFAYNLPGVYLETNVRSVFLHELFPGEQSVPDTRLVPLVRTTCPPDAHDPNDDPRTWYFSLLDYGAWLKGSGTNPSRRSRVYTKQSRFEGSHRQKRAQLVRVLLKHRATGGVTFDTIGADISQFEVSRGRGPLQVPEVQRLLDELVQEGFCYEKDGLWHV